MNNKTNFSQTPLENLPSSIHEQVIEFDKETLIEYWDYSGLDELTRREIIWNHIEKNDLIPEALKPFVLDCLNQPFIKRKAQAAEHERHIMVRDILFTHLTENITIDKAVEKLANEYNKDAETLRKYYNNPKYKSEKAAIKAAYKKIK